jgi:hypothetical protein
MPSSTPALPSHTAVGRRARRLLVALSLPLGAFALLTVAAGCGGAGTTLGGQNTPTLNNSLGSGGGNGASGGGKAQGKDAAANLPQTRLGVFVTATGSGDGPGKAFAPDYEHVWVTLRKVEVLDANDQATAVFADADGRAVDLKALADDRGRNRFALLTAAPLAAAKAHARVRLTLGKSLLLLKPGQTAAQSVALSDAVARDAEGMPSLTVPLTRARNLGSGKEDLILAFGALTLKDEKASFSVRDDVEDAGALADADRQVPATFSGVAQSVSGEAPAQTFTVLADGGTPVAVQTAGATALFKGDGSANPALADGARVTVRGALDPSTRRVLASRVKLDAGEAKGAADRVTGTVTHADADAGTLVIEPREVGGGVTPTQAAVTVTLAKGAVLRSRGGLPLDAEAFWKAVKSGGRSSDLLVSAEGDYDAALATLAARGAQVEAASPAKAHEVVIAGTAASIDADKKTLTVAGPLAEWDGMAAPSGTKGIPVVLTAATSCADADGKFVATANLLDGAKDSAKNIVRVTGLYADGKVTATRIELRPAPPKPAAAEAKAADAGGDKPAAAAVPGAAAKKPEAVKPAPGKPDPTADK